MSLTIRLRKHTGSENAVLSKCNTHWVLSKLYILLRYYSNNCNFSFMNFFLGFPLWIEHIKHHLSTKRIDYSNIQKNSFAWAIEKDTYFKRYKQSHQSFKRIA